MTKLQLACPICHTVLQPVDDLHQHCAGDDLTFASVDGIWRMLRPGRAQDLDSTVTACEAMRSAEQRGSDNPAYYRLLPFHDLSGRCQSDWHARGERYLHFLSDVLQPYELANGQLLTVLDLGAGSGWMAGRLSGRGHTVTAVDISTNVLHGLGTHSHYGDSFLPVQAEFDALPFEDDALEVVILNHAFHYSTDQSAALCESLRVLKRGGLLAIFDTPIYQVAHTGEWFIAERQARLAQITGLPAESVTLEQILTFDRLRALAHEVGLRWSYDWPLPAWRRSLQRVRGQAPSVQFPVVYTYKPR